MDTLLTARLRLDPLAPEELSGLLRGTASARRARGLTLAPGLIEAPVERAIRIKLERLAASPALDHRWLTYWLVIHRQKRRGIGLVGFKGAPDAHGEVEIGYGIAPSYRGSGIATEAAAALIDWAFSDSTCRSVVALGVRPDNRASERVLEKLGMRCVRRGEVGSDWRLDTDRRPPAPPPMQAT